MAKSSGMEEVRVTVKCSECGEPMDIIVHAEEGYISFVDDGSEKGEGFYRKPSSGLNVVDLLCSKCEPDW